MDLSNLKAAEGSVHSDNFRRGRGHGSGNGKTAVDSNERGKALQVKVISHIQNRPQKSKAEIDAISLFWSEKDIEMDGAKSPYCICSL